MNSNRSGGIFRAFMFSALGIITVLVVAVAVGGKLFDNPFGSETVDRTPPPVLTSLQDLAEFHAARGNFEVLVDVEEDVKYVPAALAGERVLFVGVGSVDAYVDFAQLNESAISMNADGTSVTITLPAPVLSEPTVDPELSHVVESDKGLFDRIGDLVSGDDGSEQALYVAAADKMSAAAAATELQDQAEENTQKLLEGLLTGLGFEQVQVVFEPPAPIAG